MFCPNCGTSCEDGAVFCKNCGASVGGASVAVATKKKFEFSTKNWIILGAIGVAFILLVVLLCVGGGSGGGRGIVGTWVNADAVAPYADEAAYVFRSNGTMGAYLLDANGKEVGFDWLAALGDVAYTVKDGLVIVTIDGVASRTFTYDASTNTLFESGIPLKKIR